MDTKKLTENKMNNEESVLEKEPAVFMAKARMTASQKRAAVVNAVKSREMKNQYTNGDRRTDVAHGWSDCSSLVWWAYKQIGMEIGDYTGDQIDKGTWVTKGGKYPDVSKMLPGDLVFFRDKNYNGRPYNDGHVEMYIGGQLLMGHGSGIGPKVRDIREYCNFRISYGGPYIGVKRYISGGGSNPGAEELQYGSNGPEVAQMQKMLIRLGYNCGGTGADGDFGQGTLASLKKFQQDHKLPVTGKYNAATKKALIEAYRATVNPNPNPNPKPNPTPNPGTVILKQGNKGVKVTALQGLLISLGYRCGDSGADGDYGIGTVTAVKNLQKKCGLTVNGVYNASTKSKLAALYTKKISGDNSVLSEGATGTEVKLMQAMLIICGYSCGSTGADGSFGGGTVTAVKKFQQARGLSADGAYGHDTRMKLFAAYKVK